jgi:hypothetical protein
MSAGRNNGGKTAKGQFAAGNSGRPKGARNKATVAIEELLEGEVEAIGRKCVEKALEGDATALRLAMERIASLRRGRPVRFTMPPIANAVDVVAAIGAVLDAVSRGELTVDEAATLSTVLDAKRRGIELVEPEQRIAALEQRGGR